MCDVPSIAVFCSESIECFPGTAPKFFLKLLVTIPVAPVITGIIVHFRFHIPCISIHKLLYYYYYYILLHILSCIIIIIIIIIIISLFHTSCFNNVCSGLSLFSTHFLRLLSEPPCRTQTSVHNRLIHISDSPKLCFLTTLSQ